VVGCWFAHVVVMSLFTFPPMPARARIPFAARPDGSLVHVSAVGSGFHADCLCFGCGKPLVARKGPIMVHHFSHHGAVECNAETVLHKAAKRILTERLETALISKAPLPFAWECPRCKNRHQGDLLRRASGLAVEKWIAERRPDIALYDKAGTSRVAIEIVVTHEPEPGAREFYRDQKIQLVEVHIDGPGDLDRLRTQTPLVAAFTSYCPVPEWQLREVNFIGGRISLQYVSMEAKGPLLRVRTTWSEEEAPALDVQFRFASARAAAEALAGLKSGTLDGLYGLYGVEALYSSVSRDVRQRHAAQLEAIGLQEASWSAHGHRYRWERGVGIIRLLRTSKPPRGA
jgi:hypothetical protein